MAGEFLYGIKFSKIIAGTMGIIVEFAFLKGRGNGGKVASGNQGKGMGQGIVVLGKVPTHMGRIAVPMGINCHNFITTFHTYTGSGCHIVFLSNKIIL